MTCPRRCWVPGVSVGWAVTRLRRCEAGGGGDDVSALLLGAGGVGRVGGDVSASL
jgi:hypothetical protein